MVEAGWSCETVHEMLENILSTKSGWIRYRRGIRKARHRFGEERVRGELLLIGWGRGAAALKWSLSWYENGE